MRWALGGMLLLAACSHGSSKLAGHWRGVRAEGVVASADDAAGAFAGRMQLDFAGDAVTITTPQGEQKTRYKVVKEDASSTVISTDGDGAGDLQTFTFVDPKTMRWQVVPGKAIVFNKE